MDDNFIHNYLKYKQIYLKLLDNVNEKNIKNIIYKLKQKKQQIKGGDSLKKEELSNMICKITDPKENICIITRKDGAEFKYKYIHFYIGGNLVNNILIKQIYS